MKQSLILILLLFCGIVTAETWIYEKTVVNLPMGEEDDQLSLIYQDDMHFGPSSFAVDEDGNVYIRTRHGNIIKKFDKSGNYICSTQPVQVAGICIRYLGYNEGYVFANCDGDNHPYLRVFSVDLELVAHSSRGGVIENVNFFRGTINEYGRFVNGRVHPHVGLGQRIAGQRVVRRSWFEAVNDSIRFYALNSIWPTEFGYRFLNFDNVGNLYFERYILHEANDLGIVNNKGEFVFTNVVFESHKEHGIFFMDSTHPFITRDGLVYMLLVTEEKIELVCWRKDHIE